MPTVHNVSRAFLTRHGARPLGPSEAPAASKRPGGASSQNATCNSHQNISAHTTSCPPGVDYDALPPDLYPRANASPLECTSLQPDAVTSCPPVGFELPSEVVCSNTKSTEPTKVATPGANCNAKETKSQVAGPARKRKRGRSIRPVVGVPSPPALSGEYLKTIAPSHVAAMARTLDLHSIPALRKCAIWFGVNNRTFHKPPLHIMGGYDSWQAVLHAIRYYNELPPGEREAEIAKAKSIARDDKLQLRANMDKLMANRPGRSKQLTAAAAARSEAATNHSSGEDIIRNREAARLTSASHIPHAADHDKVPANGGNGGMTPAQEEALIAELAKARANKEASCAKREEEKHLELEKRAKRLKQEIVKEIAAKQQKIEARRLESEKKAEDRPLKAEERYRKEAKRLKSETRAKEKAEEKRRKAELKKKLAANRASADKRKEAKRMTPAQEEALMSELEKARAHTAKKKEAKRVESEKRAEEIMRRKAEASASDIAKKKEQDITEKWMSFARATAEVPSSPLEREGCVIPTPEDEDILISHGEEAKYHPGSVFYRNYCERRREHYKKLGTQKKLKQQFVLGMVRSLKKTRRVLQYSENRGGWIAMSDDEFRKRILRRFKAGPPKLRDGTYTRVVVADATIPSEATQPKV